MSNKKKKKTLWSLFMDGNFKLYLKEWLLSVFTQYLTSFYSINHFLHLCAWFLILFHLTLRFSWSTYLQMFLSLETLTSTIRTGLPILVELMVLANYVIIFCISNYLTQMVNFPTQIPELWLFSCWLGQSLWSFERCSMGGYP